MKQASPPPARALIVGGGVAGLSSAILLSRDGWDCTILERTPERRRLGHGMVLPPAGAAALEQLVGERLRAFSAPIEGFDLCAGDATPIGSFAISGSLSLLHRDLIAMLRQALAEEVKEEQAEAIGLEATQPAGHYQLVDGAGRRRTADLIVAADGIGSLCRAALFPEAELTRELVTELVLEMKDPDLARRLKRRCRKFQDPDQGLALGLVPCREGQVVLYAQVSTLRHAVPEPEGIQAFLRERFGSWNPELGALLRRLDGSGAHVWHTADLDPLPQLHHRNVVLVGDSAHPMLPFTSQGASSALGDALRLRAELRGVDPARPTSLAEALERYSSSRVPELRALLLEGRALRRDFLEPPQDPREPPRPPVAGLSLNADPA